MYRLELYYCGIFSFTLNIYFLSVQVEHIHQSVETMKTQYLNDRRCRGDLSNPFLKANSASS
jgi:hypothetical protein